MKGEFFERRLNASIALFRIEQDKLAQQDTGYLVPGTTRPAYYASEGATSKGVELELSGELAPGWNAFFFATRYSAKDAEDDDVNNSLPRNMVPVHHLPVVWAMAEPNSRGRCQLAKRHLLQQCRPQR